MRKLVYAVHTSLDGRIEGPGGEFDWADMGPELSAHSQELTDRADTLLYGRRVWDMMSSYWPQAEEISDHPHDLEYAPIWRKTPKIVFSRTLEEADWNTEVIGGDLAARVAELKDRPGKDLLLMGGAELATALADHGLIDEFHVVVHPVVLGGGKQVFGGGVRTDLRLTGTRTMDGRAVLLTYEKK
ncbi:dihydrofolate reductase family protein [Amycolatopsis roodepoortensis]|uniref:dihydrofolate reductase family protein n=1 Tax=Amycolatopsis roodepoortensis TaxID=700274 RepID=UPI000F88162C|nr:dihydrofolate reductase family protein [Amycolatopsis roodepoortensis]RSN04522.1 deaminase [Streptomyces sp. WAC 05977]UUV33774.1 dihydrofolate reductase family protein [Amycolatopsis roodepoortensis]